MDEEIQKTRKKLKGISSVKEFNDLLERTMLSTEEKQIPWEIQKQIQWHLYRQVEEERSKKQNTKQINEIQAYILYIILLI